MASARAGHSRVAKRATVRIPGSGRYIQEMTLERLLRGRSMLRCKCGKELIVEETKSEDGHAVARFIPCQCGRRDPIHIEAGSVAAGGTSSLMFVWGPPKDPCGFSG